jgi:hypothetical protein
MAGSIETFSFFIACSRLFKSLTKLLRSFML